MEGGLGNAFFVRRRKAKKEEREKKVRVILEGQVNFRSVFSASERCSLGLEGGATLFSALWHFWRAVQLLRPVSTNVRKTKQQAAHRSIMGYSLGLSSINSGGAAAAAAN